MDHKAWCCLLSFIVWGCQQPLETHHGQSATSHGKNMTTQNQSDMDTGSKDSDPNQDADARGQGAENQSEMSPEYNSTVPRVDGLVSEGKSTALNLAVYSDDTLTQGDFDNDGTILLKWDGAGLDPSMLQVELYRDTDCQGAVHVALSTADAEMLAVSDLEDGYYSFKLHILTGDNADSQSDECSPAILVDSIPPVTVGTLDDGSFLIDVTDQSPMIAWQAVEDKGSGISHYELALGLEVGGDDVMTAKVEASTTTATLTDIALELETTYYATIYAVDHAGNKSLPLQGDGFVTVDSKLGPSRVVVSDGLNDNFGYAIATDGHRLVIGASDGGAQGSGVAYVYMRQGRSWAMKAELKAANGDSGDNFGESVALSGQTIIVGASGEDSASQANPLDNSASIAGAAYVFVQQGEAWVQEAYLKASNAETLDQFGMAVAIDGDTAVVGAETEDSDSNVSRDQGAVYVFTRQDNVWTQQAYLQAANGVSQDRFGASLVLRGDTMVVGAPAHDNGAFSTYNSGAAYVFQRKDGTWMQTQALTAPQLKARGAFGFAVALHENTLVVGAPFDYEQTGLTGQPGEAYVFNRVGDVWTYQVALAAPESGIWDRFGHSVAVYGNRIVIGAIGEDGQGAGLNANPADNSLNNAGAAYLFTRMGDGWSPGAYLKAAVPQQMARFGQAVALTVDSAIVGGQTINAVETFFFPLLSP